MPFPYPANRLEFLNGTKCKPDKFPGAPFIIGFEGVVSEKDYAAMVHETHFGEHTPIDFEALLVVRCLYICHYNASIF